MRKCRGFSAERSQPSYLPGVHRNYWGPRLPDTWWHPVMPKLTANVLRRDSLFPTTPRTFDCAKSTGPQRTKHGFIARANAWTIAHRLPSGNGPLATGLVDPNSYVDARLSPACSAGTAFCPR